MLAPKLTTTDNPWNPYTNYEEWLQFDLLHGYNCNAYLARMAHCSDELTDEQNAEEINRAIDKIVSFEPETYMKLREDYPFPLPPSKEVKAG